jgi:hypothetical protein
LSRQSITRRLNSAGLRYRIAAVKDVLTEEHRAGRLRFARRYVNMPIAFWRLVIFTDEKSWSSSAHGQIRVRRLNNQRYSRENILHIKKSGRSTVSVWGGMWLGGVTPLRRVVGNLTAVQYVNILEGTLIPYLTDYFPPGEAVTFVQDK